MDTRARSAGEGYERIARPQQSSAAMRVGGCWGHSLATDPSGHLPGLLRTPILSRSIVCCWAVALRTEAVRAIFSMSKSWVMLFRYLLAIGLVVGWGRPLAACDACGCSLLLGNWGPVVGGQRPYVGLRWQNQGYHSYADATDLADKRLGSRENFHVLEARVGFMLAKRWQLSLGLPYLWLDRQLESQQLSARGLGDLSLQANVVLWSSPQAAAIQQQLTASLAIKAPSGRFQAEDESLSGHPNFQLGSGSWDANWAGQYLLSTERNAFSAEASLRLNTTNADEYRYGHRTQASLRYYRRMRLGSSSWSPNVGVQYEYAARDVQRGYFRQHTGGYFLLAQTGLQWTRPQYGLEISAMLPLAHHWADGLVVPRQRWSVQWLYFF